MSLYSRLTYQSVQQRIRRLEFLDIHQSRTYYLLVYPAKNRDGLSLALNTCKEFPILTARAERSEKF